MMQSNPESSETEHSRRLEELADQWLAGDHPEDDQALLGQYDDIEISLDTLLGRLAGDPETLALQHLLLLSDLSMEQAATVRRTWPTIPVERRREVVRYLVELAKDDVTLAFGRLLRIALADTDSETRRNAIEGLWEETDVSLIGPLVQVLHNDPSKMTRAAAAAALGSYVLAGELDEVDAALAMRAEEALFAVALSGDVDASVRCRALESLAYSGEVGVRQLIEDAYYAPEEEMRVSSLIAMGRSADVRWRNLARAELQNPDATMRAAAAQACGELETKAALDEITDLLSDNDPEVRIAAILALGRIGGKEARTLLEAVRVSDEPEEVEAADLALEELMFSASSETEAALFEDEDDSLEEWDIEPWRRGLDADDLDFGAYEE